METSSYPPRKSSLSLSPRVTNPNRPIIPANLNIASLLSFGKQPQPSHAVSPVKRKPLPPNSPALATHRNHASWADNKINPQSGASSEATSPLVPRDLDQFPRGQSPLLASAPVHRKPVRSVPRSARRDTVSSVNTETIPSIQASPERIAPREATDLQTRMLQRSFTAGAQPPHKPPPLRTNTLDGQLTRSHLDARAPQTPGSKITQFFGWKGRSASKDDDSSSTDISDHGLSPLPSPFVVSPQTSRYSARSFPHGVDTYKNGPGSPQDDRSPMNSITPDLSSKVGQLESELKEIACELAGSIKREMDLEDLVETLQSERSGTSDETRTSDYYSDSSTSSARQGILNRSLKMEDFEKVKREAEQQKAQLRLDLSHKWQEERSKRLMLESNLHSLENQICLSSRSKEVEASLKQTRERLDEEREIKFKLEQLATSLRAEAERHRAERNKLRDEVVPQLEAQIRAQPIPSPSFDLGRMKEEMEALRSENASLRDGRKAHANSRHSLSQFHTISEEGPHIGTSLRSPTGLSRSNSLARAPARNSGIIRSGSLSRSNSIGGKSPVEAREALAERMKDVELQRDALHSAMKALLARQDCQTQGFHKQIRVLEQELERSREPPTPRRQGYEKEVRNLREEINQLRRRADEAIVQKMQCEKGLGGLKMDLDRSEQETETLRGLLNDNDITLPFRISDSLQHAYQQLQQDQQDAEVQLSHDPHSSRSLEEEQELAEQLRQSAERSEGLARQMSAQLATNQTLRNRLAQAIGNGERNQTTSGHQITELESQLHRLEDTLTAAQQQSETAVMKHEEELRILKEAHCDQLQRLKASGHRSPPPAGTGSKRGPPPLVSPIFIQRSPKIDETTSGQGLRLEEVMKTEQLEKKVVELELALENADSEMQKVVSRMNSAQIEVLELQTERDEAIRQTRKLQSAILDEREKVKSLVSSAH